MKKILENIVRRRNPNFQFDDSISNYTLFQFALIQAACIIRGWRVLVHLKKPNGLICGKKTNFFNLPQIRWGKNLKLGDHVVMNALSKKGITIGDNVSIGAYSRIIVSTSFNNIGEGIKIGNNVGIGEFAYLGGAGGLEIGDDCIVGQYLSCHPENHIFSNHQIATRLQGVVRKGIKIGKNCWIGSKVTILDGVEIGANCVIAAGSVVNKSMPSNTIIGGVPARIIKDFQFELKAA